MNEDGSTKLSQRLVEQLDSIDRSIPVEVIVELRGGDRAVMGSRYERVMAQKTEFERTLRPVAKRIADVGGWVLETVWLNQTVRGRIPAGGLTQVADDEAVVSIDLPRTIKPDD